MGLTQCPAPVSISGSGTNTKFYLSAEPTAFGKGHLHCASSMDGETEPESTKKMLSKFFLASNLRSFSAVP